MLGKPGVGVKGGKSAGVRGLIRLYPLPAVVRLQQAGDILILHVQEKVLLGRQAIKDHILLFGIIVSAVVGLEPGIGVKGGQSAGVGGLVRFHRGPPFLLVELEGDVLIQHLLLEVLLRGPVPIEVVLLGRVVAVDGREPSVGVKGSGLLGVGGQPGGFLRLPFGLSIRKRFVGRCGHGHSDVRKHIRNRGDLRRFDSQSGGEQGQGHSENEHRCEQLFHRGTSFYHFRSGGTAPAGQEISASSRYLYPFSAMWSFRPLRLSPSRRSKT